MNGIDIKEYMHALGKKARASAKHIAVAKTAAKNAALHHIAEAILQQQPQLIEANQRDLAENKNDLSAALLDRLELTKDRISAMATGLRQIAALPDPIGTVNGMAEQPSGIRVGQMRVPLGVVGIIYESRPNVTVDAAGLCLKSGNAALLRGGSEALHSNKAIAACIHTGLKKAGLPTDAIQLVQTTDRAAVGALVAMPDYVDVIVPRGGKSLIAHISAQARVPVIKHLDGICHVYIDDRADIDKAVNIAYNAKTQRFGTCNTMECLLVASDIAQPVLTQLSPLYEKACVAIRGCSASQKLLPNITLATDEDYATEYLAPILSLKIVAGIDEAIAHIARFGSQHTDAIVTQDLKRADQFLREVDSSSVMVNASTRFADGFEYGLGAEIGISTDKFHARGPVGLAGLTSKKFIVLGDGHIRV